jgi:hypothetical protein
LFQEEVTPGELARHFSTPILSAVGDEVADGQWMVEEGKPLPLALFDAARVDAQPPARCLDCAGKMFAAIDEVPPPGAAYVDPTPS